jgi:hypothetical protein
MGMSFCEIDFAVFERSAAADCTTATIIISNVLFAHAPTSFVFLLSLGLTGSHWVSLVLTVSIVGVTVSIVGVSVCELMSGFGSSVFVVVCGARGVGTTQPSRTHIHSSHTMKHAYAYRIYACICDSVVL